MKKDKIYKKSASEFTELVPTMGSCLASDKITVDGELVDYMYREAPSNNVDCGWRFFSGSETQEYVDNADNSAFYHVNTIANCDPAIIPYLHLPIGVELERVIGSDIFKIIDTN